MWGPVVKASGFRPEDSLGSQTSGDGLARPGAPPSVARISPAGTMAALG